MRKKGHKNMFFTFFLSWKQACIVTKGYVCCNCSNHWHQLYGGTIHIQHSPTEKQFQSRFQLNFFMGTLFFLYYIFYKIMTHSILDCMLPRMNIFNTVKWVSVEGKLKAKLQKNYGFLFCVLYAGRTET